MLGEQFVGARERTRTHEGGKVACGARGREWRGVRGGEEELVWGRICCLAGCLDHIDSVASPGEEYDWLLKL